MDHSEKSVRHVLQEIHTHVSQCRLSEVMKKLGRKICDVNGCNLSHNYLLHPDGGKASVNMFTVLKEDAAAKEELASENEDEDDESPRARLMRGILQAGRSVQGRQTSEEGSSEDQEEAVRGTEAASEDEKELEPEKEKNPQPQEEVDLDYCSMEAIAESWRDKPKKQQAASTSPKVESKASVKPVASVPGTKGKKNPTLLLAELLRIEGEMAVVQYDTGATASLVSSNFMRKLSLFSGPKRVQVSITSGIEGEPEEATLMHELYIKWPRGSVHLGQFLEVEKIRRLPQPPSEEVLDVIFPHPDRDECMADWGLTGGEVDILLGADMIHLFPKLDYTVDRLSLYMSFLTGRYMVMGQLPDNAPEEQLEVIRRFSEEFSGRGPCRTTIPRDRSAAISLPR